LDIKKINKLIAEAENRLKQLDTERNKVIADLEELQRMKKTGFKVKESESLFHMPRVTKDSPADEKISLFFSLFRGRQDIYARRWESLRTGKSGYMPACKNEWVKGLCRKPEIKCGECPAREFLPLSESVIRNHLKGFDPNETSRSAAKRDFSIGIYPLLTDNKCWFITADFDKETWIEDVSAFRETCAKHKISLAVERSRSGKGAHAWIFFFEPIPALMARQLGTFLLTETLDKRPELGLDSYDRLFPSQDLLPEGGFGSLIALPLQGKSREMGNTLFINENFTPYQDQWAFLSMISPLSRNSVKEIVDQANRIGKIMGVRLPAIDEQEEEPWKKVPSRRKNEPSVSGSYPKKLSLFLNNLVYIEKKNLSPSFRNRLIHLAAFQNPEFYKAQAMRLSTYGKPRIISCAEDYPKHIGLPRGCLDEILEMCDSFGIKTSIKDERNLGTSIEVGINIHLRPEQEEAANALLEFDTGVLAAATAFGKTVVAAKLIAERGVNTLVLVHRRQLFDQWSARLTEFLDLKPDQIGKIGAGKHQPSGKIDIALIQSLWKRGKVDEVVGDYGHIIVDECHHVSANSFEQVIRQSNAKFVTGLSATVTRKDGHHPIIFMQCGSVRYRVTARRGTASHPFSHKVIFRETEFTLAQNIEEKDLKIHEIYEALLSDETRNAVIFEDVMKSIDEEKRSPLLISERREHVETFAMRFRPLVKNVIVFRGGMGRKQRQALSDQLAAIPDSEERLLIATGKYLGEGFDDARLDTLFLALPISWRGTLAQYAGRLHRLHYNKKEVRIYDYIELNVPILEKMYKRRVRGYRAIGYDIG